MKHGNPERLIAKPLVLSRASRAALQKAVRQLRRQNYELIDLAWGMAGHVVTYTCEQDHKAGDTIQIRIPRKFVAT